MKCKKFLGAASSALMIVIAVFVLVPGGWAQSKFKSIYKFTGGEDGMHPSTSLILDRNGILYGTAGGGSFKKTCAGNGCGVVFKLVQNSDGSWAESVIYTFSGGSDGTGPGPILERDGSIYGTTGFGGNLSYCAIGYGCGTVFKLTPNPDGSWTKSVLHAFVGNGDGESPNNLTFDAAGNLYVTAFDGGNPAYCDGHGCGTVLKLTPKADGNWTESVLYTFTGGKYGSDPTGLTLDTAGNIYGTLIGGGGRHGSGLVFKLTPNSDGTWTESVLYSFCSLTSCKDGWDPWGGLIFDAAGNLYGTTSNGGGHKDSGVAFKLTPNADGSWTESVLHRFCSRASCADGRRPWAGLTLDAAGNLYGTTAWGGDMSICQNEGCGVVFKLAPTTTGEWKETVLHRFYGHPESYSQEGVIFDAAGNLYGTTTGYYSQNLGSVFEITP